ncbi:MAG: hypothetical protein NUW37_18965 [Planctomycetes bacterium]|nr:hypothetical protein [Planctomycetota bacterium]
MIRSILYACALLLFCGESFALTLDGVEFGKEVIGKLPTREEMRGKVVVLESFFPENTDRLVPLYAHCRSLGERGPILIGMLIDDEQADDARRVIPRLGLYDLIVVGFTKIMDGTFGMQAGRCVVFDHKGDKVFDGNRDVHSENAHDQEVYDIISQTCANAPDPIVGEYEFQEIAALATEVVRRRNLGRVYTQLTDKIEDPKNDREKEEAEYLRGRLDWFIEKEKTRLTQLETDDPGDAIAGWRVLSNTFSRCPPGDEIKAHLDELEHDRDFRREVDADAALDQIEEMASQLDRNNWQSPDNMRMLQGIAQALTAFDRRFGETKQKARADRIRAELGL